MDRDALVSRAGYQLFSGLFVLVAGNALAGALGSLVAAGVGGGFGAAAGLLTYLLAAVPVLYVAAMRLARGLWVVAEGSVHAANGFESADST